MKIINERPPNYDKIAKVFDIEGKNVVFTYGDVIYNPLEGKMDNHLLVHESIHAKQQGNDPEEWWERYLSDVDFRISQEVEAYAVQYNFIRQQYKIKVSDLFLDEIAFDLSSEIYGSVLNFYQAHTRIKKYAQLLDRPNS